MFTLPICFALIPIPAAATSLWRHPIVKRSFALIPIPAAATSLALAGVLEPLILKGFSLRQARTKVHIHGLQLASNEAKEVFRFHQIPGNHSSPE